MEWDFNGMNMGFGNRIIHVTSNKKKTSQLEVADTKLHNQSAGLHILYMSTVESILSQEKPLEGVVPQLNRSLLDEFSMVFHKRQACHR